MKVSEYDYDKFVRDYDKVTWTYYNPDGNDGNGQFIEIIIYRKDYEKALEVTNLNTANLSTSFINSIYATSECHLINRGTELFKSYDEAFMLKPDNNTVLIRNVTDRISMQLISDAFETDKVRLYVDMDGTLCNFEGEINYIERMYEPGFFLNLKPYTRIVNAINKIVESGEAEVFILSSCVEGEPPHCKIEKSEWLDNYMPGIDEQHRLLVAMGADKSKCVTGYGLTSRDILYDDYNTNLVEWLDSGGTSVKCLNDRNGKGLRGISFYGDSISNQLSEDEILFRLRSIINNVKEKTHTEMLDLTEVHYEIKK